MRDDAVEARLVADIGIVALAARVRSVQTQFGVRESRARSRCLTRANDWWFHAHPHGPEASRVVLRMEAKNAEQLRARLEEVETMLRA